MANSGTFRKGDGRQRKPKGTLNRTTTALKDAILKAAELTGHDDCGKDGLIGYLRRVAETDVKAFSGLLGKVLPIQVAGDPSAPLIPGSITFVVQQQPGSNNRT